MTAAGAGFCAKGDLGKIPELDGLGKGVEILS
jgi:hypothetical protein